jgi:diamine N-acetyltransferase
VALADRLLEHAMRLNVNKRNAKAIRAYQLAGFRIAESVVNEFGDGFVTDDYRMELDVG